MKLYDCINERLDRIEQADVERQQYLQTIAALAKTETLRVWAKALTIHEDELREATR